MPEYGGCLGNDELAKNYKPRHFYVVNLQNSDQGGSHWVLVFGDLYFDPYGTEPTLEVKPYVSIYNTGVYQAFNSEACGYFCCYAADNILAGMKPEHGLKDWDTAHNEKMLMDYFPLVKKGSGVQLGSGIFSSITSRIKALATPGVRTTASKRLTEFLNTTGREPVMKIEVARKPVLGVIQKAINWISLGKFAQMKKQLGYDDIYHSYLLVTLADGRTYRVERNHQIEAKLATKDDIDGAQSRSIVPMHDRHPSLQQMIDTASRGNPEFWRYTAANNNCQRFTQDMMLKNNLHPADPPKDLVQDAPKLVSTLPGGSVPLNALTDLAQKLDEVAYGGGASGWWTPPDQLGKPQSTHVMF